jgi:hypothetical protein
VGAAMFAIPAAEVLAPDSTVLPYVFVLLVGVCMTGSAYFGIKGLEIVSYISVPLIAILGTYAAGNNYAAYPVLSLDNVVSGITHCISGFASLYILISGMASMKKENIFITFSILLGFCVAAYIANILIDYNYMFLMRGDGTPYDILFNLVGGHKVLYPVSVVVLFLLYITGFYGVYYCLHKKTISATASI